MKKPFIKKVIPFLKARFAPRGARQTFSTCGEDLIMNDILGELGVKNALYVDIGAHHPVFGNNTYLLYRQGGHGVLVEPNPELCALIRNKRPRDICLNAGAGRETSEAEFYAFKRSTRSTFSKQQAEEWEKQSGQKPTVEIQKTHSLDSIIDNECKGLIPDVVSIDAEGYDVEILLGFSWAKRPKIFCIESVLHDDKSSERDIQIHRTFKERGYRIEVQTRNNSIFVDKTILT
jgi:FkbM family methyltransferase